MLKNKDTWFVMSINRWVIVKGNYSKDSVIRPPWGSTKVVVIVNKVLEVRPNHSEFWDFW